MQDAYDIGLLDKKTMREFDEFVLDHGRSFFSQANKNSGTRGREPSRARASPQRRNQVGRRMERGEKEPSGPSLKLLALVKAKGLDAIA